MGKDLGGRDFVEETMAKDVRCERGDEDLTDFLDVTKMRDGIYVPNYT